MKKFNMSIKFKLAMVLSVFVVISTGAVAYCLINIKNQKSDALIINIAGRQRALSQLMTKSVFGLYKGLKSPESEGRVKAMDSYKSDIMEKKKLFNDTMTTFMEGGGIQDTDGTMVAIPRTADPSIRTKLDESRALWERFSHELDMVVASVNDPDGAQMQASLQYIEGNNMPLFKDMNKLTMMYQAASDAKLSYFKKVLYAGIIINLVTFAAVIWTIHRLITARLNALHKHMKDITTGEGDLTKRIDTSDLDEIGVLGQEFNALLGNFEVIISRLMGSCALLKGSSERLSSTFSSMVDGLNRQDQKTRQVATATEEMSATVIEVARNASNMANMAHSADVAAKSGDSSVKKVIERMNGIASSAKQSVQVVAALGNESQKIGNIVQVINDIADQTNLLALNAAIEAARAGEQGRGFAVVADEVRKLAERTTKATKEINEMVSGIQNESKKAVESIEMESAYVEEGVDLTKEAGAALTEITGSINQVNGMIQMIATSTEQQSAVASSISTDMDTVAQISMESSNGVKDVSELAGELSVLAHELEQSLMKFKVSMKAEAVKSGPEPDEDPEAVLPLRPRFAVGDALSR